MAGVGTESNVPVVAIFVSGLGALLLMLFQQEGIVVVDVFVWFVETEEKMKLPSDLAREVDLTVKRERPTIVDNDEANPLVGDRVSEEDERTRRVMARTRGPIKV